MKKSKVYVYGDGSGYNSIAHALRMYKDEIDVLGILTTDEPRYKFLDGIRCYKSESIKETEYDYIIISTQDFECVVKYLHSKFGIDNKKTIPGRVLGLPFFDWSKYIAIKDNQPSIMSFNCMAGFIYHELGLYVNSPTCNCYCSQGDFWKFVENIEKYKKEQMYVEDSGYIELADDIYQGQDSCTPHGRIGDIVWSFNHTDNPETFVKKWNERLERVNPHNMFVIGQIYSDSDFERFEKLKCKKIGFSVYDFGMDNIVWIKEWAESLQLRMKYSFRREWLLFDYLTDKDGSPGKINWINLLYDGKDYLRF